jgi:60 kDa SS-A/Ro ribonucleoprotein
LSVLTAHLTYAAGHSIRGSATWTPVREIIDALDAAFYAAFGNVEPTGKRHLLALDVSGSMDFDTINGVPGLTPRVAAAAMALVTMATGDPCHIVAFSSGGGFARLTWGQMDSGLFVAPSAPSASTPGVIPLAISPGQRIQDVCAQTHGLPHSGTDCALPWIYAAREGLEIDVAVTYTDSETWAGSVHPSQALNAYREKTGIAARAVVVGMVSNGFSIADPKDAGQLDVVGFDASAPQVISDFAAGKI